MNRQSISVAIYIAAIFTMHLSAVMLIPAIVDFYYGNPEWKGFCLASFITGITAIAAAITTKGSRIQTTTRFKFLLVNLLWLTMVVVGMLPFLMSSLKLSLTDCFFEAISGVTTTGATIINNLDRTHHGLLIWRSLLSFIGGLGVIGLGLFLLPLLNIGGISYFKIESSDISDRPFERLQPFIMSLLGIYSGMTIICFLAYITSGMEPFHAINHAMSTIATGGFSTHDTSFFRYADHKMILWISSFFMFISGLPFSILIVLAIRGRLDIVKDPQIKAYTFATIFFIILIAIYLRTTKDLAFIDALTLSAFNFISLITTAGFVSDDYTLWGPFAVVCVYLITFIGGCSGSTSGGIKIYRFIIVFQCITNAIRQLIYPNMVQTVRYADRSISSIMQQNVLVFMTSFFIIFTIFTILLGATGLDFITALTASLTSFTNVGPALGSIIGPSGNFSTLPDTAKWICSIAMLLGRLEILTILVILSPVFWRQ